MEQQAKVTSVDALENFRASLILFLSKAKPALEEVMHEVVRTRLWIENDQRTFWEREIKTRRRKLEQAQAELFSARISKLQEASAAQQMAVQHATRAIHAAEEKMRMLKKWNRELENLADPLVKQIEQLHGFLMNDMGRLSLFWLRPSRSCSPMPRFQSERGQSPLPFQPKLKTSVQRLNQPITRHPSPIYEHLLPF